MPLFESVCVFTECGLYGRPVEHYYPHSTDEMQSCEVCGGPTRKIVSGFNSPLMGVISASKYADRSIEGAAKYSDSHWVWERNTPDKKPKPRRIETFQQQREFCKSEGLLNPSEIPRHMEPGQDGKSVGSRGYKGQWI